ncbi:MAG: hypothetical protein HZA58_04230 [Acidimicrobiia bacterium]|nr:hypothetical protein [Acidimicrobiia bacterium]
MTQASRSGRRPAASSSIPVADVTAAFASVFAALTLALAGVYATAPAARPWLASELGLVSWFTRGAFAGAIAVGVWAARRSLPGSRFHWLIPTIAAWGLLDTIHYGLPLFGIVGPRLGGVAISSLTALADGCGKWAVDAGLAPGLGVAGIVMVVLGGYAVGRRGRAWAAGRVMVTEGRVVDFLVASCCLLAATPAIGSLGGGEVVAFASRLSAMTGATVLVAAALAAGDHRRTVAGWRNRMRPWLDDTSRPRR